MSGKRQNLSLTETMNKFERYKEAIEDASKAAERAGEAYVAAVQEVVDKHGYWLATGHASNTWQIKRPKGKGWKGVYDFPEGKEPQIFADLDALESLGEDFGIGPSNMEMFKPSK